MKDGVYVCMACRCQRTSRRVTLSGCPPTPCCSDACEAILTTPCKETQYDGPQTTETTEETSGTYDATEVKHDNPNETAGTGDHEDLQRHQNGFDFATLQRSPAPSPAVTQEVT